MKEKIYEPSLEKEAVKAFRAYITGMRTRGLPDNDLEKMMKTIATHLCY